MRLKYSGQSTTSAERVVKVYRRATRRKFSAENKIRILLESLRGNDSIPHLLPHEPAVQLTCKHCYFVPEANVYKLMNTHDILATGRRFRVLNATLFFSMGDARVEIAACVENYNQDRTQ
jgi:hypothetical protein